MRRRTASVASVIYVGLPIALGAVTSFTGRCDETSAGPDVSVACVQIGTADPFGFAMPVSESPAFVRPQ